MEKAAVTGFTRIGIERAFRAPFIDGNAVELLASGIKTFEKIFAAVAAAREYICLQFYIYRNDETGTELARLLKEKARAGVRVYLTYDHLGSFGTPRAFWRDLRAAGVHVSASYPFVWHAPRRYYYRDHRKVLIVDGEMAFTGGLNIANEYRIGIMPRRRGPAWRDTGFIIRGPAVGYLLGTFSEAWRRWGHERLHFDVPSGAVRGPLPLIPIFVHSRRSRRLMRKLLYHSINRAVSSICLTTAYFTPSIRMFFALRQAVKRGVSVTLLVPGRSDVASAHYAGRASFARLLRAGVRICTFRGTVLHAKTYIFDRHWSIVGSANLDYRSLRWNDEGNVGILDFDFGKQMIELFEEDLANSTQIDPHEWSRRPLMEKLKEQFFWLFRTKL
jgi:cardiolipin synthase